MNVRAFGFAIAVTLFAPTAFAVEPVDCNGILTREPFVTATAHQTNALARPAIEAQKQHLSEYEPIVKKWIGQLKERTPRDDTFIKMVDLHIKSLAKPPREP